MSNSKEVSEMVKLENGFLPMASRIMDKTLTKHFFRLILCFSCVFFICAVGVLGHSSGAVAQTFEPLSENSPIDVEAARRLRPLDSDNGVLLGQMVGDRARPDYDQIGLHAGPLIVLPAVSVEQSYDSNIYKSQTGSISDWITSIQPKISVATDLESNFLRLEASGDISTHAKRSGEDWRDYTLDALGRLDVQRDLFIIGEATYAKLHEDRGSPDDRFGYSPNTYSSSYGLLGASGNIGSLNIRVSGTANGYNFDNNLGSSGVIDNRDRDRVEYQSVARVGYEYNVHNEIFLRATYDARDYDLHADGNGFIRGGSGYTAEAGLGFELTPSLRGEVRAGVLEQSFNDARFSSVSAPVFGVEAIWNADPLLSVKLSAFRTVEETTLPGAAAFLSTSASMAVQYELLRNMLLEGDLRYFRSNYLQISRADDIGAANLGLTYFLDNNFALRARMAYSERRSQVPGGGFDDTTFFLRLTAGY
jgi:hypothetical protein